MKNKKITRKITESAVMLALATVLSYFKLLNLPYGGSITLCSMLPVMLMAYRYGTYWGLFNGFVYSVIQLLFGLDNLSYATSSGAVVAIIMLDYIMAFTAIGFGGIFRKIFKEQTSAVSVGMSFICLLRYICHVISGCTVWAGVSIPDGEALVYSLAYNATYMLPELIVSVIGAVYVSSAVDFGGENLRRKSINSVNRSAFIVKCIGFSLAAAALVVDVVLFAENLQNAETGNFDISCIANVNYVAVLSVTGIGATLCAVLIFVSDKIRNNKKVQ